MSSKNLSVGLTILAIVGCIGTYMGDLLLLAVPLSGSEYYRIYQSAMINSSHARLLTGNTLGLVFLPLQLFGLWLLHLALSRSHLWLSRLVFFTLAYSVLSGLAYHVTFAFLGTGLQVDQQLNNTVTRLMIEQYKAYNLTLFRFAQVSLSIGALLFAIQVLWKETLFPKWIAILNPLLLLFLVRFLTSLIPAPVGGYIRPVISISQC